MPDEVLARPTPPRRAAANPRGLCIRARPRRMTSRRNRRIKREPAQIAATYPLTNKVILRAGFLQRVEMVMENQAVAAVIAPEIVYDIQTGDLARFERVSGG